MTEFTTSGKGGVFNTQLIEHVREGMEVYDAAGEKVGKVESIKMGDPEAATVQGQENEADGLIGAVARTFWPDEEEPDVPEPKRAQLLRYGFLKVDAPGLDPTDRYVRADFIAQVAEDQIRLSVTKDDLIKEH